MRQAEGKEQVILRKDVDEVRAMSVSMMPEDLPKTVTPRDLADLLAWLRRPPTSLILVDENQELIEALNEGAGTAEFIAADKYAGQSQSPGHASAAILAAHQGLGVPHPRGPRAG